MILRHYNDDGFNPNKIIQTSYINFLDFTNRREIEIKEFI